MRWQISVDIPVNPVGTTDNVNVLLPEEKDYDVQVYFNLAHLVVLYDLCNHNKRLPNKASRGRTYSTTNPVPGFKNRNFNRTI